MCRFICRFIKEKSELIVHVWGAYPYRKDNMDYGKEIVFVVLTSGTDNVDVKDFSTYQRCILEVNRKRENVEINAKELHDRPSLEETQNLEKCLEENAKSLMKAHSKLTRVTASWFKAGVTDTGQLGQFSLQKELCIALYVHVKGFVPLNEKPFPPKIGKYPVDVREGLFTLCGGPDEYHGNVKMGCSISGERQGTLGAFIEFENEGNLYGITSAHVVFSNETLKRILEYGNKKLSGHEIVYQPYVDPFGTAVAALYKQGGNGNPGMEIALIKINRDRWPTEGTFPDDPEYTKTGFGPHKPFVFCSGKFLESTNRLQSAIVYKYGGESKLTRGMCRVNGASVRTQVFKDKILDTELVMHGQIEIQSLEADPFAKKGDSGAMVFTDEQSQGDLSAVGIFEGQMEGEHVFTVTPIWAVLDELQRFTNKRNTLTRFPPYQTCFEDPRLGENLYEKVSALTTNVTDLSEKLERIEQDLAQDLAVHKKEITDGLKKQSEEHKTQTQEIKEQHKNHSEEQKKQTQEIKDLILNLLQRQNTS